MTAKPVAARVAALRQRRAALGLTRLEVYVHPDDHANVKTLVTKLRKQRDKSNAFMEKTT
jgi:hypothetical protein